MSKKIESLRNNLLFKLNAIGDYSTHKEIWDAFYEYEKELRHPAVIIGFRKRYFFDGALWYKQDEGKKLEIMTNEEIEVMKENTVEGQWLLDGKFQYRTDIRTWVTKEIWV